MITSDSNEDTLEAITPTTDSGESLISLDDIPDENQETSCFSCKQKLRGLYCHQCGQKNDMAHVGGPYFQTRQGVERVRGW